MNRLSNAFALSMCALIPATAVAQGPTADAASEPEPLVLDDAESLAMDSKLYASEFGVSYDEALSRMTQMIYGSDAANDVVTQEGTDYAGRFFDNKASDFGLVIATKKTSKPDNLVSFTAKTKSNFGALNSAAKQQRNAARKMLRAVAKLSDGEVSKAEEKLSKPVSMKVKYKGNQAYALSALHAGMAKLIKSAVAKSGVLSAVTIDEPGNTLRVFTEAALSGEQAKSLKEEAGVPVSFDVVPGGFVPTANIRGGSKLYFNSTDSSSSQRACMTAFGARVEICNCRAWRCRSLEGFMDLSALAGPKPGRAVSGLTEANVALTRSGLCSPSDYLRRSFVPAFPRGTPPSDQL